jgi:dipeptidyl aminopeptidase/acylaminoacyl peptidase
MFIMPRLLRFTKYVSLLTSFLFLLSCSSNPTPPPQTALLIYRFDSPAFIEYSADLQPIKEIPFSIPPNCGLFSTFPAPAGKFMAIELSCPNGQTVLFLDTSSLLSAGSASVTQPITDSDAHFLAWTSDGKAAYLKVDLLGSPRVICTYTDGTRDVLAIPEFTYDLSAKPDSRDFTFTLSRGLGYGSEMYLAGHDGRITTLLYADQYNYLSFARFSPDGEQLAFIKIPDTQTPFTVGELWVISTDGSKASKLADADAGHGYAANWSPDGTKIAYVVRENPKDKNANQSSEALISNIYVVEVESGKITRLTFFKEGRAETPFWSPDGNTLAFTVVLNGRMEVRIADVASGEIRSLITGSACCPAWMRK